MFLCWKYFLLWFLFNKIIKSVFNNWKRSLILSPGDSGPRDGSRPVDPRPRDGGYISTSLDSWHPSIQGGDFLGCLLWRVGCTNFEVYLSFVSGHSNFNLWRNIQVSCLRPFDLNSETRSNQQRGWHVLLRSFPGWLLSHLQITVGSDPSCEILK